MNLRDNKSPLRLVYTYRYRLIEGIWHDVRMRYVGSLFGSTWAFLFPILQLGIYAGLYSFVLRVRPQGLDEKTYSLLVFSGLVPLLAFNEAMVGAMNSLSANRALLLNTVFPAELIPLRSALAAQVPGLVGLVVTLALGLAMGRTGWTALVFVPLLWVALVMFAIGVGWVLSLLSLVAKDIQHGIGLAMMLLFILSPFAYTPEMVPSALRSIVWINPLSYFVLSFQQIICYGGLPGPAECAGALGLGLFAFFAGFMVFQKAKKVFFDYA